MAEKPFLVDINLNLNELKNAKIQSVGTDPTTLVEGLFWYNNNDKSLKYYDGVDIQVLAIGGNVEEALTMSVEAISSGQMIVSSGPGRGTKTYDGGTGILKSDANGVISPAIPGTDYLTQNSINSLTNKIFDANGTGNSISNIEVEDLASSALATDVDTATSSQLVTGDKIKQYVDNTVGSIGGEFLGDYDASTFTVPDGTNVLKGDYYRIATGGTISGLEPNEELEPGDIIVARVNNPSDSNDWFSLQGNISDTVSSATSVTEEGQITVFSGTSGKIITKSTAKVSDGNVDILSNKEYRINGTNILNNVSKIFKVSFIIDDWVISTGNISLTLTSAQTGLDSSIVQVYDDTNNQVMVDIVQTNNSIILQANGSGFSGYVIVNTIYEINSISIAPPSII